ncbi:pilus assembly protein HofO [Striga asiatica]|uniref:Pilus assembly protein HofO n=1 Tax=Striga asiatica TaxID=4170 RepID=A0A5A7NWY2_STRAF|nr:pilus assembly protein HofO [Striga asiatica]
MGKSLDQWNPFACNQLSTSLESKESPSKTSSSFSHLSISDGHTTCPPYAQNVVPPVLVNPERCGSRMGVLLQGPLAVRGSHVVRVSRLVAESSSVADDVGFLPFVRPMPAAPNVPRVALVTPSFLGADFLEFGEEITTAAVFYLGICGQLPRLRLAVDVGYGDEAVGGKRIPCDETLEFFLWSKGKRSEVPERKVFLFSDYWFYSEWIMWEKSRKLQIVVSGKEKNFFSAVVRIRGSHFQNFKALFREISSSVYKKLLLIEGSSLSLFLDIAQFFFLSWHNISLAAFHSHQHPFGCFKEVDIKLEKVSINRDDGMVNNSQEFWVAFSCFSVEGQTMLHKLDKCYINWTSS